MNPLQTAFLFFGIIYAGLIVLAVGGIIFFTVVALSQQFWSFLKDS